MGAIADAIVAFAQPLLDGTDGSVEEMNKAFALGTLCWNLALRPKAGREAALAELRPSLEMDDHEFAAFRLAIIDPMIRRHEQMFPGMHGRDSSQPPNAESMQPTPPEPRSGREKYPGTGPYAPCPCNSGRKYKFCCRG